MESTGDVVEREAPGFPEGRAPFQTPRANSYSGDRMTLCIIFI